MGKDDNGNFKVLIVDDDQTTLRLIDKALSSEGYAVVSVSSASQVEPAISKDKFDMVLLDLVLPGTDGIKVLREIKEGCPDVDVVVMSGKGSMRSALNALQYDAYDFLPKPFDMSTLLEIINKVQSERQFSKETKASTRPLAYSSDFPELIGCSEIIEKIKSTIDKIASTSSNVLVQGETGTGKEVVAQNIHYKSDRNRGPFVAVNCSALPENLLESELFGYERGAFTDASSQKVGLLEAANGGTLFLDEVGDISSSLQAKLLRAVETKRLRRLGSTEENGVDVRIISATNVDIVDQIRAKKFRKDLFYRLGTIIINIPPIRERKEDIPLLIEHFLRKLQAENKIAKTLSLEVIDAFRRYHWPGNIRELQNIMERIFVFSDCSSIRMEDLPQDFRANLMETVKAQNGKSVGVTIPDLASMEKSHIQRVIQEYGEDKETVAEILGISIRTLYHKLKKHSIDL